jgi:hypothetical protein
MGKPRDAGLSVSRPVSRILSRVTIPLGRPLPAGSSGAPGPSAGSVFGACFALHRTGFGEPPCHHDAGGLLPHLFTLTAGVSGDVRSPEAVSFLCHFPSAFAAWDFPSVLPCGVRTFLERARRSFEKLTERSSAITRPADWIVAWLQPLSRRAIRPRTPGRRSPHQPGEGRTRRRRDTRGSLRAAARRAPARACD